MDDSEERGDRGNDPGVTDLETAVRARLDALDAGNYRANTELVLGEFVAFLREERGVDDLEELTVLDCRRYAQYLRSRASDPEETLSAASTHANGPYFTIVRAFLSWCVDDERLDANPARPNRVRDALPEYHGNRDRQFWPPEARDALLDALVERVRAELDTRQGHATNRDELDPTPFRDRAIVAVLAFTGVRGAEVFADPRDEHRDGLRWADVDLDRGVARVLGKTRERQSVALTDKVVDALDRYQRVLAPPTDEWPVFPTRHRPSLSGAVRDGLEERGWSEAEIEAALDEHGSTELLRHHEIAPPALSKNGARNLMQRLCESAGIDVDGEYLKPHGGRRALGDRLYAADAELAQETLRHESIETTHDAYREQNAVERRERIEDVLDGE
ncbi:tyrosine-type recombinase/integrase [Natronoarchaeum rubrum]|uniref:tyrosine-type recombinase/integrase n=2 Tax=Natronoarchaeum rubrum TaxID=755311 RepID=UPI0021123560|nr:site-specific integrase [Natronoarchaeum rubrum]